LLAFGQIPQHIMEDAVVSLVKQPFGNPKLMMQMVHLATEERLRIVISTILNSLRAQAEQPAAKREFHIAH